MQKVYIPVYDRHWKVVVENLDDLRVLYYSHYHMDYTICKFKKGVGFYGTLYNASTIFDTEAAAFAYIHKDYKTALAGQHNFNFEEEKTA